MFLPASSDHYRRTGLGWGIAAGFVGLAAVLFLPAPPRLPRAMRLLYGIAVAVAVLELAISQCSQWISDYRVVLSAGTFANWLIVLFAPRLWIGGRSLVRTGATYLNARPMVRRTAGLVVTILLSSLVAAWTWERFLKGPWERVQMRRQQARIQQQQIEIERHAQQARNNLFAELRPITLANCEFQRFGEPNDGGYVLCGNLLGSVQSAYSYGISGYDQWGCDVTHRFAVPVHQYDCFNLRRPVCPGGRTVFHGECVAGEPATIDGRVFDTPARQFTKNDDGVKRLVVKMDVEGAEWDTWQRAPDAVLQQIDQLTIELHGVSEPDRFLAVIRKLKRFFYVANLHFNNFSCLEGIAPFPAEVYEVLFVSKRLAVTGGPGPAGAPAALMTPNIPKWKDCQTLADLPPVRPQ